MSPWSVSLLWSWAHRGHKSRDVTTVARLAAWPRGAALSSAGGAPEHVGYRQSVATSSAWQISRILTPLSEPIRSTSTATDTDSTESRFTALRRPIGSSPGSSTTSLGRPRIVVVHGATIARPSRGIAASRDNTTTGRRPISGGSHHHSSPRVGRELTWPQPHFETTPDRPSRRRRRSGEPRTQSS